jgi:hypothetical protein
MPYPGFAPQVGMRRQVVGVGPQYAAQVVDRGPQMSGDRFNMGMLPNWQAYLMYGGGNGR